VKRTLLLGALLFAACGSSNDSKPTTSSDQAPARNAAPPGPMARQMPPDRNQPPDRQMPSRDDRRQQMMQQFDKDGDGQLSDDERAAMKAARAQDMFQRLDADGDGKVTQAELDAAPGRGRRMIDLATADTDHDGALSAAELTAAMPDRHGGPGGWHGHDHGDDDGSASDAP
jgi:hypothetical protein